MSLLNKASLILTPNAVKESKLYSIVPSNGNGDMSVVRATTATRVNELGYIEDTPYNLFKYSEMFSDASWTKALSTITANTTIAPNGTLTADTFTVSAIGQSRIIYTGIVFNIGRYVLSIYIKNNNINFNYVELGNSYATFNLNTGALVNSGAFSTGWNFVSASSETLTNGWFRFIIVSDCTISGSYQVRPCQAMNAVSNFNYPNVGDNLYIWGAQLVQGSVPKDYFYTTNRLNVPRLNYDVAGGCPAILLEPQRTNLNTNYLVQDWSSQLTRTINFGISPENIQNSTQLINVGLSNQATSKNYSLVSGTTYTFSLWIKKTSGVFTSTEASVYIYPQTPSVSINFSDATSSWKRYSSTFTSSITGAVTFQIRTDVASTIEIYGVQLEVGSYPTSIIPTVGSTVTRNADLISRNNIYTNGLITSTGNTWFLDQSSNQALGVNGICYVLFIGSQFANSLIIQANSTGTLSFRKFTNSISGVNQIITNSNVLRTKLIIRWNASTGILNIFLNGVLAHTFTSQTFDNYETLVIYDVNSGGVPVAHSVYSTMLFPTPLTDTECTNLTTL